MSHIKKGMNYIEVYGKEKAISIRNKQSIARKGNVAWTGKTWEERFGYEKAQIIRKNQSGKNNINWRGRPPIPKYPSKFSKGLKRSIRKRDFRCVLCDINLKKLKQENRRVIVHHIDYDVENNRPNNLVTLCGKCLYKIYISTEKGKWEIILRDKLLGFEEMKRNMLGYLRVNIVKYIKE